MSMGDESMRQGRFETCCDEGEGFPLHLSQNTSK